MRNTFSISGIVSQLEADNFDLFRKNSKLKKDAELYLNQADEGFLSSIGSISKKSFSIDNFDLLSVNEKKKILDITLGFIIELSDFKSECYKISKVTESK